MSCKGYPATGPHTPRTKLPQGDHARPASSPPSRMSLGGIERTRSRDAFKWRESREKRLKECWAELTLNGDAPSGPTLLKFYNASAAADCDLAYPHSGHELLKKLKAMGVRQGKRVDDAGISSATERFMKEFAAGIKNDVETLIDVENVVVAGEEIDVTLIDVENVVGDGEEIDVKVDVGKTTGPSYARLELFFGKAEIVGVWDSEKIAEMIQAEVQLILGREVMLTVEPYQGSWGARVQCDSELSWTEYPSLWMASLSAARKTARHLRAQARVRYAMMKSITHSIAGDDIADTSHVGQMPDALDAWWGVASSRAASPRRARRI